MNQKTKYVLEIAKLHTDACTNEMIEVNITIENGFLAVRGHNRCRIDGYAKNYNFFLGPKAQWDTKINMEKIAKKKSIN